MGTRREQQRMKTNLKAKTLIPFVCVMSCYGQENKNGAARMLEQHVPHYAPTKVTLVEATSKLSEYPLQSLHIGLEVLAREKLSDPLNGTIVFSADLRGKTISQILDALCGFDPRYTWSTDGSTANIYPRATTSQAKYVPNLRARRLRVQSILDPDGVFGPLHVLLPEAPFGYMQLGVGDIGYAEPWSRVFENLTVRQLINRVAEHMGQRTSWLMQPVNNGNMFTFQKGAFFIH